jgi:hypothetical protein
MDPSVSTQVPATDPPVSSGNTCDDATASSESGRLHRRKSSSAYSATPLDVQGTSQEYYGSEKSRKTGKKIRQRTQSIVSRRSSPRVVARNSPTFR